MEYATKVTTWLAHTAVACEEGAASEVLNQSQVATSVPASTQNWQHRCPARTADAASGGSGAGAPLLSG